MRIIELAKTNDPKESYKTQSNSWNNYMTNLVQLFEPTCICSFCFQIKVLKCFNLKNQCKNMNIFQKERSTWVSSFREIRLRSNPPLPSSITFTGSTLFPDSQIYFYPLNKTLKIKMRSSLHYPLLFHFHLHQIFLHVHGD